MRVYELMEQLALMPAGAELIFSAVVTEKELREQEVIGTDEESQSPLHVLRFSIDSVEEADACRTVIYGEMR